MTTSGGASNHNGRTDLAWTEAAAGYAAYFQPRFMPWLQTAVAALAAARPSPGALVSPGCGPGVELNLLAAAFPERNILGIDLAGGMVRLARQRTEGLSGVEIRQGDGTDTAAWPQPCGGVLSCFTLQLLPTPDQTLAAWTRAMAPGGVSSVLFWPAAVEQDGPFALIRQVLQPRLPPVDRSWEARLVDVVHDAGGTLLRDEIVSHAMHHPDAITLWRAMASSGPLRTLALERGDAFVDAAAEAFLRLSPEGSLTHEPQARLMIIRRQR